MVIEVDLTAHQAMKPFAAHREVLSQQIDAAVFGSSANEDHLPTQGHTRIERKVLGHGLTRWSTIGRRGATGAMGRDVGVRTCLEFGCATDMMTLPDLG